MTIAVEEKRVRSLFDRVEAVEDVARTLPENDERRAKLLAVSTAALADEGTIRPVIAAKLLGLSEKTVRAWAERATGDDEVNFQIYHRIIDPIRVPPTTAWSSSRWSSKATA